jgi:hypothetical protein
MRPDSRVCISVLCLRPHGLSVLYTLLNRHTLYSYAVQCKKKTTKNNNKNCTCVLKVKQKLAHEFIVVIHRKPTYMSWCLPVCTCIIMRLVPGQVRYLHMTPRHVHPILFAKRVLIGQCISRKLCAVCIIHTSRCFLNSPGGDRLFAQPVYRTRILYMLNMHPFPCALDVDSWISSPLRQSSWIATVTDVQKSNHCPSEAIN